jgi:hypothetical protein
VIKRWVTEERGNGKQTEHGMRGIFIGFDSTKKGFLFYMPGSRNIIVSADATFDKTFHSEIATTWQQHRDTLALQPSHSYIPDVTTDMEHTGTVVDNLHDIEEGEKVSDEAQIFDKEAQILNNPDSDGYTFEEGHDGLQHDAFELTTEPMVVDCSNNDATAGPRRTARPHKPNPK